MTISTKQTSDKSSDSLQLSLHPARSDLVPGATDEQVKEVLAFEGVPELAAFYRKIGWNPEKEFKILISIVEDEDEKSDTRLRALKELSVRRSEILQACGLKVKATRVKTDPSGVSTVCQADIVIAAMGFGMPDDVVPDGLKNQLKGVLNERTECITVDSDPGDSGADTDPDPSALCKSPDSPAPCEVGGREELVRGKDGIFRKRKSGSGRLKGTKDSPTCLRSVERKRRRTNRRQREARARLKSKRELAATKIKSVLT